MADNTEWFAGLTAEEAKEADHRRRGGWKVVTLLALLCVVAYAAKL